MLSANFKPKTRAAASRGYLATARLFVTLVSTNNSIFLETPTVSPSAWHLEAGVPSVVLRATGTGTAGARVYMGSYDKTGDRTRCQYGDYEQIMCMCASNCSVVLRKLLTLRRYLLSIYAVSTSESPFLCFSLKRYIPLIGSIANATKHMGNPSIPCTIMILRDICFSSVSSSSSSFILCDTE